MNNRLTTPPPPPPPPATKAPPPPPRPYPVDKRNWKGAELARKRAHWSRRHGAVGEVKAAATAAAATEAAAKAAAKTAAAKATIPAAIAIAAPHDALKRRLLLLGRQFPGRGRNCHKGEDGEQVPTAVGTTERNATTTQPCGVTLVAQATSLASEVAIAKNYLPLPDTSPE